MDKILISSCFLGNNVRYDSGHNRLENLLIKKWHKEGRLIVICPEVSGGLSIPRPAAEIQRQSEKVITINNIDVSDSFISGANKALALCKQHHIQFALLKESSPSCGSTMIYDGSFSKRKVAGEGITTSLLRQHNIQVFSELSIEQLANSLHDNK